jgi:hypothetical protein
MSTLPLSSFRRNAASKCFVSAAVDCQLSHAIDSSRFSILMTAPPPAKAVRFMRTFMPAPP